MKIQFLGAGDAFAANQGHNSGFIPLNNTNLFLDFPATNREALRYMGKDLNFVRNVFITHTHADHINGLEQLAYYSMFDPSVDSKIGLYVPQALISELRESLHSGISRLNQMGKCVHKTLDDYFDIHLVQESFRLDGVLFEIIPTLHVPEMPSYGLLVKPHFYFSGDTVFDREQILSIADHVNVIYHECHLWDTDIAPHTSLKELKTLPPSIQEKLVLMHYRDLYVDKREQEGFSRREPYFQLAQPIYTRVLKTAVYPGSFDPITNGHLDIIQRAAALFDRIVVLLAKNSGKNSLFSFEERKFLVESAIENFPNVVVDSTDGLTVRYLQENHYYYMVRGFRSVTDYEYEMQLAMTNKNIDDHVETIFLPTSLEYTYLSSSIVRERARHGDDVSHLVPKTVNQALKKKFIS